MGSSFNKIIYMTWIIFPLNLKAEYEIGFYSTERIFHTHEFYRHEYADNVIINLNKDQSSGTQISFQQSTQKKARENRTGFYIRESLSFWEVGLVKKWSLLSQNDRPTLDWVNGIYGGLGVHYRQNVVQPDEKEVLLNDQEDPLKAGDNNISSHNGLSLQLSTALEFHLHSVLKAGPILAMRIHSVTPENVHFFLGGLIKLCFDS